MGDGAGEGREVVVLSGDVFEEALRVGVYLFLEKGDPSVHVGWRGVVEVMVYVSSE